MSYINDHKAAYEKLQSIEDVDAQHIALYHAFFYQFNKFGWPKHLLISRETLMNLAKIGSTNTFYKKVKQLHEWEFIKYKPSKNPLKGSRYTYIRCDTSTNISTDTSTDTSSDTLIRPIDNKTKRHKESKYQFNDLWSKYELGGRSKGSKKVAQQYWIKLSEGDKENAVELVEAYLRQAGKDKNGKSFGKQVRYYLRDKEWEGLTYGSETQDPKQKIGKDVYAEIMCNIPYKRHFAEYRKLRSKHYEDYFNEKCTYENALNQYIGLNDEPKMRGFWEWIQVGINKAKEVQDA